jgi:hypothetical protein
MTFPPRLKSAAGPTCVVADSFVDTAYDVRGRQVRKLDRRPAQSDRVRLEMFEPVSRPVGRSAKALTLSQGFHSTMLCQLRLGALQKDASWLGNTQP